MDSYTSGKISTIVQMLIKTNQTIESYIISVSGKSTSDPNATLALLYVSAIRAIKNDTRTIVNMYSMLNAIYANGTFDYYVKSYYKRYNSEVGSEDRIMYEMCVLCGAAIELLGNKQIETFLFDKAKEARDKTDKIWNAKELNMKEKSKYGCLSLMLIVLIVAVLSNPIKNSTKNTQKEATNPYTTAGESKTVSPKQTPTTTPEPKTVSFPRSGTTINHTTSKCEAPFIINMPRRNTDKYYFVLCEYKSSIKTPVRMVEIFASGTSKIEVDVPLGKYRLYIFSGNKWYGTKRLFGDKTNASYVEEMLDFYEDAELGTQFYEITMEKVVNGNLERIPIDIDSITFVESL